MNAKILLEFLPADNAGLSPLAHTALSGEFSVPGVRVARSSAEVKQPADRTDFVGRAHALGLSVFPYTFLDEHSVEGLFTNFPDKGVAARDKRR